MDQHPVIEVFDEMVETVRLKAQDYADEGNVFSNFEGAARIAGVSVDTVFTVMMGIKIERLRQMESGKEPNFEGIEDTLIDLANYTALKLAYKRKNRFAELRDAEPFGPYSTNPTFYECSHLTGNPYSGTMDGPDVEGVPV